MPSVLAGGLAPAGLAIMAGLLMGGPSAAQTKNPLLGSWRLVSAVATTSSGERDPHPFGANPSGMLSYMRDGRMAAMIAHDRRAPLSGDRISSPSAERAEAFATFFAYAGRYRIDGDKVVHHVEIASVPNWVGTDLVRVWELHGNRLTLSTPLLSVGGRMQSADLVWEREKQ